MGKLNFLAIHTDHETICRHIKHNLYELINCSTDYSICKETASTDTEFFGSWNIEENLLAQPQPTVVAAMKRWLISIHILGKSLGQRQDLS